VDLGSNVKVLPTYYCLKYGSSANYCVPRNWKFQASNDTRVVDQPEDDSLWITLRTHTNDLTLNADFAWFVFPIEKCSKAFRYFRILQTGPNAFLTNRPSPGSVDSWSNVLVTSGFDLFGLCVRNPETKDTKKGYKASLVQQIAAIKIC